MEYFAWCVMAAAVGMGLGSFGTGIGQGVAISKAVEGVARNPEIGRASCRERV